MGSKIECDYDWYERKEKERQRMVQRRKDALAELFPELSVEDLEKIDYSRGVESVRKKATRIVAAKKRKRKC
ncbi:hypothetical protein J7J13_04505 [bacterium]|nr:hypothetical protein [bacterium]